MFFSVLVTAYFKLQGCLSETWATVTKAAVAEAILALTKLDENIRNPQVCAKTPTVSDEL